MAALLLSFLLALPLSAQDPPPKPEQVAAAVTKLQEAFARGTPEKRIEALDGARDIPHEDVVREAARGLRDSEVTVRAAAIECLRFQQHPDALKALHDLYRRDKKLRKDEEMLPKLLKAIGQHQSPSSIPVFTEQGLDGVHDAVVTRILALGNVRTRASLDALVDMLRAADRERVQGFMHSFQLALARLTGVDQGISQDAWMSWWNDNKKTIEVPKTPPKLPEEMQRRWDSFWGNELRYERAPKRGDRGG